MTPNSTQQPPNPIARGTSGLNYSGAVNTAPKTQPATAYTTQPTPAPVDQPTGYTGIPGMNPTPQQMPASAANPIYSGVYGSLQNAMGSYPQTTTSPISRTSNTGAIDYSKYRGMTPSQVYSMGAPAGWDWAAFDAANGTNYSNASSLPGTNRTDFTFNDVKPQDYGMAAAPAAQLGRTTAPSVLPPAIVPPNMRTDAGPGSTVSGSQPGTSVSIPNPATGLPGLGQGGIQNQVNTSNVPALAGGDALRQQQIQAQQAAYQQATAALDPQWANQENALRNSLVNQGIPQNSEAWNKSMDDFQRQKAFAYQQAQAASVQQGLQAQNQLFTQGLASNQNQFGQNLSSGQFTNAAQQQAAAQILQQMGYNAQLGIAGIGAQTSANSLAEQIAQNNFNNSMGMRQQDINELLLQQQNPLSMYQALTQGNGVTSPNFTNTPGSSIGGTDIASIIAQALGQQNNVYNAQVGAQNSNTAAAASIIAALLSDRRFKTNVRRIGMHEIGVPLYAFDYVWGEPGIGVMADELERVMPHAVIDVGGMKAVNYAEFSKVA